MANRCRSSLLATLAAVALAAAAGEARADWLVTKDGARVETKGTWKVDGRRIVFTMPNGTLSAMRADDVDLDQSAAVTAKAAEAIQKAAQPQPEPKREPVLRLTEKDIPPSSGEGGEAGEGAASAAGKAGADTPALEVISWEKTPTASGDGVEVFGTIRNNSANAVTSPTIVVAIYGGDGGLLATSDGSVNSGSILAGKTANFRVAFPGVTDFTAVKFDAQGRGFRQNPAAAGEGEGESEGGPGEEAPPPAGAPSAG